MTSLSVVIVGALLAQSGVIAVGNPEDAQKLRRLDEAFGTSGPVTVSRQVDAKERVPAIRSFVASRLRQEAFYETIGLSFFETVHTAQAHTAWLKQLNEGKTTSGKPFYYLAAPCPELELSTV